MKREKEFLKEKFVEFQLIIAELTHALSEQEKRSKDRENDLYMNLFDVIDAFENLNENIREKGDSLDKTARLLSKSIQSIHRKLIRLLKTRNIIQIEFPDKKAKMENCKIVDTKESGSMESETILSVVKNGYIDRKQGKVLRKAEVITVLNSEE